MEALDRWRVDTPATLQGLIHLNNAGASLMPAPVLDAVVSHLRREAERGGYEAAEDARDSVAAAYEALGRLVGCSARNIAVVENATVGFAQAVSVFDLGPDDCIVTTRGDYVSNQLLYLSLRRRSGVAIARAADLPEGGVDPDSVRRLIRERRPALVAVSWVPTNSGLVQPVEEIGEICAEAEVPYLIDACQAVGQIPIDVDSLRCDFLSATARKFLRGPRGVGFLYVSDRVLEAGHHPLYIDMRGADWTAPDRYALAPDARRFENWEFAYALVLGLGAAARYALEVGIEAAGVRASALAARLRAGVVDQPGVRVLDRGSRLCAIATVDIAGRAAEDVVRELREWGINSSASPRSSAVIDMDEKGVAGVVRLSPHYFNTEREIDSAVSAVADLARP